MLELKINGHSFIGSHFGAVKISYVMVYVTNNWNSSQIKIPRECRVRNTDREGEGEGRQRERERERRKRKVIIWTKKDEIIVKGKI